MERVIPRMSNLYQTIYLQQLKVKSFTTINSGYVTFGPNVKARYDEIAAFNSALSASEIDRIYKYGIRGNSNLAGYWRMGDASGGTGIIIPDELGGEDAQLRNGAFFSNDTAHYLTQR